MMGQKNMIRGEMGPVFTPMAQSLVQLLSLPYLHYSAVTRKHVEYVEAGSAIHTRIVRTSAIVELHRIPKKKKVREDQECTMLAQNALLNVRSGREPPSHGAVLRSHDYVFPSSPAFSHPFVHVTIISLQRPVPRGHFLGRRRFSNLGNGLRDQIIHYAISSRTPVKYKRSDVISGRHRPIRNGRRTD